MLHISGDFPCASQHLSISENKVAEHNMKIGDANPVKINRKVATAALGLSLLSSSHNINMNEAIGAGLPPEDKPRLCDADCEKELENVCWGVGICPYALADVLNVLWLNKLFYRFLISSVNFLDDCRFILEW